MINNKELLDLLKSKMPSFEDDKKLNNMLVRVEKLHSINGKAVKKVYTTLNQALSDISVMTKNKHKLLPERCRSSQGAYIFFYELSQTLANKALENALNASKNEYLADIEAQQSSWLDAQLEEALEHQRLEEHLVKVEEEKAFKSKLLEALQKG